MEVGESEKKFSRPEKILKKFKTKKYEGRMKISVLRQEEKVGRASSSFNSVLQCHTGWFQTLGFKGPSTLASSVLRDSCVTSCPVP